MDVFGDVWKHHEEKFKNNADKMISEDDTLVLIGDHSWSRKLSECREDFSYIEALPGRKILVRGNHDMFWDAKKTEKLNREFDGRLLFLQGNFYTYKDYALVGTKGYTFEGSFYVDNFGHILDWDKDIAEKAEKLVEREYYRLKEGFEKAVAAGYEKFIMFLHYPPTNVLQEESCFTKITEEYHVEKVIYAHCHGEERYHDSIEGNFHGVEYHLASGDFLKWVPMKVMD